MTSFDRSSAPESQPQSEVKDLATATRQLDAALALANGNPVAKKRFNMPGVTISA